MTRNRCLPISAVLIALLAATACWGQAPAKPEFNTANDGVKAADVEAAGGVLCLSADITRSKNGSVSGCRVCPKGTDFRGMENNDWQLYAETPGHFTSAKDDNLILSGTNCDSHASNFGGSFVFSLKTGRPVLLKYDKGLVTDRCHKLTFPDSRDFLVCQGGWSGQGEIDGSVFMSSFDATGKDVTTQLFATTDTTLNCGDDPTRVVKESGIIGLKFSTNDSGAFTGMTIFATLGDVKCSQVKSKTPPAALKTYQVEFLFNGKRFNVAAASRAAFNRFPRN